MQPPWYLVYDFFLEEWVCVCGKKFPQAAVPVEVTDGDGTLRKTKATGGLGSREAEAFAEAHYQCGRDFAASRGTRSIILEVSFQEYVSFLEGPSAATPPPPAPPP